jgi:hypothetical protein
MENTSTHIIFVPVESSFLAPAPWGLSLPISIGKGGKKS